MADKLHSILSSTLDRFVRKDVLEIKKYHHLASKMAKHVFDKENLLPSKTVIPGFASKIIMQEVKKKKKVSLLQVHELQSKYLVPRSPTHKFNDGGRSDRGSYFIPKKSTTSEFVYPKKSLLFLVHQKKSLSPFFATPKISSVFLSRPKKISASFIDPKNHFWPKFQTPPPSLKYVSGAPGILSLL